VFAGADGVDAGAGACGAAFAGLLLVGPDAAGPAGCVAAALAVPGVRVPGAELPGGVAVPAACCRCEFARALVAVGDVFVAEWVVVLAVPVWIAGRAVAIGAAAFPECSATPTARAATAAAAAPPR
jgi:hypothetical protein